MVFALVLAAIGLVVAAFTPRRGFGVDRRHGRLPAQHARRSTAVQGIAESQTQFGVAALGRRCSPRSTCRRRAGVGLRRARQSAAEPPPDGIGGPVFALLCVAIVAGSLAVLYAGPKAGAQ